MTHAKQTLLSILLVVLQFTCLILMTVHMNWSNINTGSLWLLFVSMIIGTWALINLAKSKFSVLPVPREKAILVTSGIYKWIRHPMYTALIVYAVGIAGNHCDLFLCLMMVILISVLMVKIAWEEKWLAAKFPEYSTYAKKSRRLVPFLY